MLSGKRFKCIIWYYWYRFGLISQQKLFNEINVVSKTVKLDLQGGGDDFSNVYTIQRGVPKLP